MDIGMDASYECYITYKVITDIIMLNLIFLNNLMHVAIQ